MTRSKSKRPKLHTESHSRMDDWSWLPGLSARRAEREKLSAEARRRLAHVNGVKTPTGHGSGAPAR